MKAALFDLDGTLINSLADIAWAMNLALREHGLREYPEKDYRYFVGSGVYVLTSRVIGERTDLEEKVRKTYMANYAAHSLDRTAPYPGIENMLRDLKRQGVKLCVFSNKPDPDTQHIVRHFFGGDLFDAVQGQISGIPIKPDPAGALQLAQKLDVKPAEMLYAGDSGVDMQCAVRAGMQACGVLWGFRDEPELRENGARFLLHDPAELTDVIKL